MLEVKVEQCAGIDVGKKFIDVCVLIGPANRKPAEEVRRFGTNVVDLEALRAWLKEKACTEVVMESTGSYWKPVFNILEGHFKVILANPEQVEALRGKKTDRKDCRWLAGLLRHGLVQASFIPPRDIRELRDLTRRRRLLLQNGTQERNRVQKVLGRRQCQNRQCAQRCFRNVGASDAGGAAGESAQSRTDGRFGSRNVAAENPSDCGSAGRTPHERSSSP